MVVEVDRQKFVSVFDDFVKTGKVMFNFLCNGDSLNIQLLAEFTVETIIECKLVEGKKETVESSYYISAPIHILNKEQPITIDFGSVAIIRQGNFAYTLIPEFEARKELPVVDEEDFIPMNSGRLQYLSISSDKLIPISKELKTLPAEPMFVNGHYYVRYDNAVFIDEFDLCGDICITHEILKQVAPHLGSKASYALIDDGNQVIIRSKNYTYYILTTNFYIKGNNLSSIDSMIVSSKKVGEISFVPIKDNLSLLISTLPNQKFMFSIKDNKYCISITSADSVAVTFLGENLNNPNATIYLTSGRMSAITRIFGDEDKVEVYIGPNIIRFAVGTKNLILSGLIY